MSYQLHSARPRPLRTRTSHLYTFFLVSLTTFVVVLLLSGGPQRVYEAAARLRLRTSFPGAPEIDVAAEADQAIQEIREPSNLRAAWKEAGLPQISGAKASDGGASALRAQLRLAAQPVEGGVEFHMKFTHADAVTARRLLHRLADRYATVYQQRIAQYLTHELALAREELQQAQYEHGQIEQALKSLVDELLPAEGQQPISQRGRPLLRPVSASDDRIIHRVSDAPLPESPRDQAERSLAELRQRREELLRSMTPEHPDVQQLSQWIAELEARLAGGEAPALGAPQPVFPAAPARSPGAADASSTLPGSSSRPPAHPDQLRFQQWLARQATAAARRKELQEQARRSEASLIEARAAEQTAWQRCLEHRGARLTRIDLLSAQPRLNHSAWRWQLLLTALVSVVVAGGAVALASVGEKTLTSLSEAQQRIAAPVVGCLPSPRRRGVTPPAVARRCAQAARGLCELIVVSLAISLVVALVRQPHLLQGLWRDPLQALMQLLA
jgi:hypothetical protein